MKRLLTYGKYISIFLIFELMITFIVSLLNLIGLNSGITSIILFISNILLFFILTFSNSYKRHKKGLLEGLLLGIIFLILMFLIKVIFFKSSLGVSTLIYYIILIIVSLLGGTMGVNKKSGHETTTNS